MKHVINYEFITSRAIHHRAVTKHDTHDTANEQIHSRSQYGPTVRSKHERASYVCK